MDGIEFSELLIYMGEQLSMGADDIHVLAREKDERWNQDVTVFAREMHNETKTQQQ